MRSRRSSSRTSTRCSRGSAAVEDEDVTAAVMRRPVRYDRDGDSHYDTISAYIKSVRASDPDAALFYLAVMLEGGEDPVYIARRIAVLASEDIGNADPRALELAVACARVVELVGLPECRYALSQATAYLAMAPKSNAAATSLGAASEAARAHATARPPAALRDSHYRGARGARQRRRLPLPARRAGRLRGRRPPAGGARRIAVLRADRARPRGQARRAHARAAAPARTASGRERPQMMRWPRAEQISSTASSPVMFSRSRIGLTSTTCSDPNGAASASSSIARCASR